jgi:hypothetical protein
VLQGAVHALEVSQAQSDRKGGWYYKLDAGQGDHEGSTTVTVLQALRAAKEAGVRVDVRCIRRAIDYLGNLQVSDGQNRNFGGFRYTLDGEGMETRVSFALTAASIASLNQTGDYDSKAVDLGIAYMRQKDPLTKGSAQKQSLSWLWYERLYATQAYFQYRDLRHFRQWYPALVSEAGSEQGRDGSFSDSDYGDVYATATAALTLAVPFGYLPTFQR